MEVIGILGALVAIGMLLSQLADVDFTLWQTWKQALEGVAVWVLPICMLIGGILTLRKKNSATESKGENHE
jgi:hypothetical protein